MRRCDIEAATPLCGRRRIERNGQHGVHFTCYAPMRYRYAGNTWVCPTCGNEDSGLLIAARRTTIEVAA